MARAAASGQPSGNLLKLKKNSALECFYPGAGDLLSFSLLI